MNAGQCDRRRQGEADLDPVAIRRGFERAASTCDLDPVLQREVARRMGRRLDLVKRAPQRLLDLGCGTGADLAALAARYPAAELAGCDACLPRLRRAAGKPSWVRRLLTRPRRVLACADVLRLPFPACRFDLVWSNLALQSTPDLAGALGEALRVLDVEGLLMFSMPGPDTLKELREAFAAADDFPHVHRFRDMHDVGDMLVACGFADPVMEMERITLTYSAAGDLFRDLRRAGAGNAARGRRQSLTGRAAWRRMLDRYDTMRVDGRLPATFEIVFGHAWKPQPLTCADGRAIVRFARAPR